MKNNILTGQQIRLLELIGKNSSLAKKLSKQILTD